MTEHEPGEHQEQSDWDRAIEVSQRLFALQPDLDLNDPKLSEHNRREMYRLLGVLVVIVSLPVAALIGIKKIAELVRKKKQPDVEK